MTSQLVQSFPQHLKYLHTYCSMAFYILTLLLDGYKFNEQTWSNIHFSRQVNTCGQQERMDMFRSSISGVLCARDVSWLFPRDPRRALPSLSHLQTSDPVHVSLSLL